jgi:hypothetical protein
MSLRLLIHHHHQTLSSYESMRNVPVKVRFNNWGHAKEGTIRRVATHKSDRFYYRDSKGQEHWRFVFFGYDPLEISPILVS